MDLAVGNWGEKELAETPAVRYDAGGTFMAEIIRTTCCIAGGGPAGMMLGFLLARAGVPVVVLEKHRDFFRDFRGDTIHPSTLEVMYELGLLDDFLKVPHQKMTSIGGKFGDTDFIAADFSHLPVHCKFVLLMPQWDFLNFIADKARRYSEFQLKMEYAATDLIREGDRVTGVRANSPSGPVEIFADLTVAADGRHSDLRLASKLEVIDFGAPIDVLWMRVEKKPSDPVQTLGYIRAGQGLVLLNRGDYWQGGYIIPKGAIDGLKRDGIELMRKRMAEVAPFLGDGRLAELKDWNDIKLLSVQVNRLKKWYLPGFLCIGDAAHAMSPAGGVGINLAIQDAIAAANILAEPLRNHTATEDDLRRVQKRRELPTKLTQGMQIPMQNLIFKHVIERSGNLPVPFFVKLLMRFPFLRRIPARVIGMGFRPEHIHTPEILSQ
jgi:2-polyprenyl-6-methoxyphenol hydroxylase-like FAD-dependent oxidoreductase